MVSMLLRKDEKFMADLHIMLDFHAAPPRAQTPMYWAQEEFLSAAMVWKGFIPP